VDVVWSPLKFMVSGVVLNTHEFHKGMREYFGIKDGAGEYLCKIFLEHREARLDIVKLDGWLMRELGFDYNVRDGLSMKQAIVKYYGEDAMEFVRKAL